MTNEEIIALIQYDICLGCDYEYDVSNYECKRCHYGAAIAALKAEDCEDAVKRQSVLNTLDTMDKALDENRTIEAYKELLKECYKALPPVTPTAKESLVVGDAVSREFQELIVEYPPAELCTYPEYRGKPYFSIKYKENGQEFVGYGTYNPDVMSRYLRDYFIKPPVTPKPRTGKWIEFNHGWGLIFLKCPFCGEFQSKADNHNFCPNCGAKMEGE